MAVLDIDGAIANVKSMLAGLSAWQTITGTSTSAAAAKKIYEYGVEATDYTHSPCIILDIDQNEPLWTGGKLQSEIVVTVHMELEIPEADRTTYSTQGRWFWQKLSAMLAGINGAVNGAGGLMLTGLTMPLKPGRIEDEDNVGRCEWMVILGLRITL